MKHRFLVSSSLSVFAIAALLLASRMNAQPDVDWDAVEIQPHHVNGNVYYLEGRGGNIGLSVGEDGVIMVDDQFAPAHGPNRCGHPRDLG